jgi:ATP-dependent helicase/DNAse subunit B
MSTSKKTPKGDKKRVSYSQFANWYRCRHRWFLDNVKGLRTFEDSVSTCFGTAMHEAIQLYIETLYKKSAKEADSHDLNAIFLAAFDRELAGGEKKAKPIEITPEVRKEYIEDAANIITSFTNMTNRIKHFPSGKYEFIGVEDEIIMPIKQNIEFVCYIDLVLKEKATGRYRIIDIKTSTSGWNRYQTENPEKYYQVLLYKAFFSRKYDVNIDMIDVEFFILRRKLWENYAFPQSRIQTFIPKNDQKSVAKSLNHFSEFVTECFTENGTFITNEKVYLKNPGKAYKNCKYCVHKGKNCFPKKSDIEIE